MPSNGLIGSSRKFMAVLDDIDMVAPVDSAVLIRGETGTGKEVVAQAIHDASPRRQRSFVATNVELSRARSHPGKGVFRRRIVARCSWTKSATCLWNFSPSSCAFCRNSRSSASAAVAPFR